MSSRRQQDHELFTLGSLCHRLLGCNFEMG